MATDTAQPLTLTLLPDALIEAGYQPPRYRVIYTYAVDRAFPATRAETGRWYFEPRDIHQIAEGLGLERADAPANADAS